MKPSIIVVIFLIMLSALTSSNSLRFMLEDANNLKSIDYFNVKNIVCTVNNCPPPHFCTNSSTCKCAEGFANYFPKSTTQETLISYCTYEQKKQLTAFLLQFFVFCAGQFYVGNIQYAIPQLIIGVIPWVLTCLMIFLRFGITAKKKTCIHNLITIFNCLSAFTFCAWWLADVIIFGMNNFNDNNGVPLQHW